jgi:hypothetical protein
MKRILAAAALALSMVLPASPSFAAGTPIYGSVKLGWSVTTTATMQIVTQYNGSFAQGTAAPSLLPSSAGVCSGSGSETAFNLSYGAIAPSLSSAVACTYTNAVAVGVTTNDSAGFKVNQYLDSTPGSGAAFCAYPNGGAAFPLTAGATLNTSVRSGNPAAGTFAGPSITCVGAGAQVPIGAGGASSAGTTPGNPGTAGLEFYSPSTASQNFVSNTAAATSLAYAGEDLQLNLPTGAASSSATSTYMTLQMVPN